MAYRVDIYYFTNSREYEYKYVGQYGAAGEKRAKRQKATPEQVKRQNQINKVNRCRRLIKANFYPNDAWVCLKYPKGTRKSIEEVKKDLDRFNKGMRKDFRIRGEQYKWVRRIEIGKHGGLHIHLVINNVFGLDLLIAKNWSHLYHMTSLYEQGDFRQLASYICKEPPEEYEQLSFLEAKEIKQITSVSSSRNLVRPQPERKPYVRRTMKRIITDGPKASQGFYIDLNSIRIGINQYTGYSYVQYTEIRIKQVKREIRAPGDGYGKEQNGSKHLHRAVNTRRKST